LRQFPEAGMTNLSRIPPEHQEPGGIPLSLRVLGHQLGRQVVVVILDSGHITIPL
jgi:hypothetical protein